MKRLLMLFSLLNAGLLFAQSACIASSQMLQARKEFQDMKYGMFIHRVKK